MSRATAALPPALRRSKRRAVAARRLNRPQPEPELDVDEDEEPVSESESDDTEGLPVVRVEPTHEGLSDLRCEPADQALRFEPAGQALRQRIAREGELREVLMARPWASRPLGPAWASRPFGPVRDDKRGEESLRGESLPALRGEYHPVRN